MYILWSLLLNIVSKWQKRCFLMKMYTQNIIALNMAGVDGCRGALSCLVFLTLVRVKCTRTYISSRKMAPWGQGTRPGDASCLLFEKNPI